MAKFSSLICTKPFRKGPHILVVSLVIISLADLGIVHGTSSLESDVRAAFAQPDTGTMPIQVEEGTGLSIIVTGKVLGIEKTIDGHDLTEGTMQVYSPDGMIFTVENTTVNTLNREYKFHVNFENDTGREIKYAPTGIYKIVVTYGNNQRGETEYSFYLVGNAPQPAPFYQIQIEGKNYTVYYRLTQYGAGNLVFLNMTTSRMNKSLVVNIESDINGTLAKELPRALINSSSYSDNNGKKMDSSFAVLVDGKKIDSVNELTGQNPRKITFVGLPISNITTARDLEINFTSGTKQVEIIGTELAPEFDGFSSFVLVIGAAASVMGTTFLLRYFRLRTTIQ